MTITTFDEIADAQQNLYNVGHDLAAALVILGLTTTDGDIVTEMLSVGCDATTRTSFDPALTGSEPGLDGYTNFESDTSLTQNVLFSRRQRQLLLQRHPLSHNRPHQLALYRFQRYAQSLG